MAEQKYSYADFEPKTMAKALGKDLPISTKFSIEITRELRKKSVKKAKQILQDIIDMKKPIKITRFTNGVGHKKGVKSVGAYPVKAATHILKVLNNAQKNAENKNLEGEEAKIIHINAHKGTTSYRYGRHRGLQAKHTHIEIIIQAKEMKKITKKEAKKLQSENNKKLQPENKIAKVKKVEKKPVNQTELKAEEKKEKTQSKEKEIQIKEIKKEESKDKIEEEKKSELKSEKPAKKAEESDKQ